MALPLAWVIHVGQFFEAWAPVVEVVVVLVAVGAPRGDGAEAPGQRALPLVVVDQRRVVGWHVGVAVCHFQTLPAHKMESTTRMYSNIWIHSFVGTLFTSLL